MKVPQNWILVKTKDVAEINSGIGFPKIYQGEKEERYPFYKVGDISETVMRGERYITSSNNYVSESICKKLKGKPFKDGSIIFAKIGEALKLNRRAILTSSSLIDNNVMCLSPNTDITSSLFLYYFWLTIHLEDISRATTVPSVRKSDVEDISFPLPPLNEQHRIVAKIEELFTKLDAAIAELKNVKQQVKRYRQSVLKNAFEGKLISVGSIQSSDSGNGKLYDEWKLAPLGDLISPSKERFEPLEKENKKYIGLEHIEKGTGKIIGYADSDTTRSTKSIFHKGDLLYGKLRPYLNKVAIAEFDGVCSTDILVFKKKEDLCNSFLKYRMMMESFVAYTQNNMSGVQHPRVNYQTLSRYEIMLPDFDKQIEIVQEIEFRLSVTEKIEEVIEENLKRTESFRQSILKKAFEGKLVSQDPKDEPAEKLLERIKTERMKDKSNQLIFRRAK